MMTLSTSSSDLGFCFENSFKVSYLVPHLCIDSKPRHNWFRIYTPHLSPLITAYLISKKPRSVRINTSWGIYWIPNKSRFTAVFMSIRNEIHCVYLLGLSSRLKSKFPISYIISWKNTIIPRFVIEILTNLDIA